MAHFALLWKARTIEKYRLNYERQKLNSIRISSADDPKHTLSQKWKHQKFVVKQQLTKSLQKLYPEGSKVRRFCSFVRTDQEFYNLVLKGVIGFVVGMFLTYLCFMFFVFQLSLSLIHATIMSSIIGVLLTMGLAFSLRIRCLVFLLIPQLFSRVGRYTLTCYALVLILTGPATNTLKNLEVLTESMACGQEQIKTSVHQFNESIKKPFNAMRDSIKLVIDRVRKVAVDLKTTVLKINRLVINILNILQSSFAWLTSVSRTCNRKLGAPYQHCTKSLLGANKGCQAYFGPQFAWLCNMGYVANVTCWTMEPIKEFCGTGEFMNEKILGGVIRKLKTFTNRLKTMLYVDINIHHSYFFSNNASGSASQVAAGIVTEIRNRADPLLTWLSWSSCITSLFLLLVLFRAKYYQHMFETRSRFDNRFVTKELRHLDLKRLRQDRETILPLNRREKAKYITTTSFRLVSSEKVHLSRSAVFMVITTFKLMIHIVADYSLYWVLMTIRYHGKSQVQKPASPALGAYIPGTGPVGRILKILIESITLPLLESAPSQVQCLPDPNEPNLKRYTQIGILIFLLWFFALFEPYGLRLRHVIMGSYRPERAKARAFWLFNHIQRTRASFMKLARRKLHREFKYSTEEKYTFKNWVNSHLPCCCQYLLGTRTTENKCLLCGTIGYPNDPDTQLIRCDIPKCPGIYCSCCFSEIGELCTICLSPANYGDLSDISLEKGSSAESSDNEHDSNILLNVCNANMCVDASFLSKTDDSDDSKHSNKPNKNNKWSLFGNNSKTESQEHIPLLHCTDEVKKEVHESGSLRSTAMMVNICEENTKSTSEIRVHNTCKRIVRTKNRDISIFRIRKKYKSKWKPSKLVTCVVNYFKNLRTYTITRKSNTSGNTRTYRLKRKLFHTITLQVKRPVFRCSLLRKQKNRKTKKDVKRISTCITLDTYKRSNSGKVHGGLRNIKKSATTSAEMVPAARKTKESQVQKVVNSNKNCNKDVTVAVCCNNNNPIAKLFTVKTQAQQSHNAGYRGEAEDTSENSESNNKIRNNIENFRNLVSNYLTTSKLDISSNAKYLSSYFRKLDVSLNHEKTNHKRRKKDYVKKYCDTGKKYVKSKKVVEDARKYRISTYLLDQDWIKRRYNKNKTLVIEQNEKLKTAITKTNKIDSVETVIKNDIQNADKCKEECLKQRFLHKNIYMEQLNRSHPSRSFHFYRSLGKNYMTDDNFEDEFICEHKQDDKKHYSAPVKVEPSTNEDHEVSHQGNTLTKPKQNFKINFNDSYLPVASGSISCKSNLSSNIKNTKIFPKNREDASNAARDSAAKPDKFWTPLSVVKYLFLCHMFVKSKKKNISCKDKTFRPHTFQRHNRQHLTLKTVSQPNPTECVNGAEKFCTCATQYYAFGKDISTNFKSKVKSRLNQPYCKDASTKDTSTMHYNCYTTTQSCAIQCNQYSKVDYNHESPKSENIIITDTPRTNKKSTRNVKWFEPATSFRKHITSSVETFYSTSSSKSDEGTKTDTTICSLATFDYLDETTKRNFSHKRPNVNVVTKANQSTSTDTKIFCNASTLTSDWWSPIVERNEKHKRVLEKKEGKYLMKDRTNDRRKRDAKVNKRSILTEGKVVKFRSQAQIIPMGTDDILSPSRYLLESQKYYNELFSPQYYAPHVFPVNSIQNNPTKIEYKWTAETGKLNHMRPLSRNEPNCAEPKRILSDISLACRCPSVATGSL